MFKQPAQRLSFGLLILIISACQSTPAAQPTPSLPPTATNSAAGSSAQGLAPQASATLASTQVLPSATTAPTQALPSPTQAPVATATSEPTLVATEVASSVQTNNPLPQLMQLPAIPIQPINPNSRGLLAVPFKLPALSSQPINEASLPQIELLQTIGLGSLQSGDFAPNSKFMVVATSLGFGVLSKPEPSYFMHSASAIKAIRVSPDNTIIEALIEVSSDPAFAGKWSIERYNVTTGEFIERLATDDTDYTWNTQPTNYDQPNPRIISPDGQIEARFAIPEGVPSDSKVSLIRLVDQKFIYEGNSSKHLRFSADSSQALLVDDQVLTVVTLYDGHSQTFNFPVYYQPTFSPNSQLLAIASGQQILKLEPTKPTSLAYEIPRSIFYRLNPRPDFSSDSNQINLGVGQWNLSEMNELWQQQLNGIDDVGYNFIVGDADQQIVVESVNRNQVELHVSQAGQALYTRQLDPVYLVDLVIVPNQNQLALVTEQGQVSLLELSTGTTLQTIDLNQPALALAVSADGQTLAVATQPSESSNICAVVLDRASLQVTQSIQCHSSSQAFDSRSWYPAIQFSPDSQLLLLQSAALDNNPTEPNVIIYRVNDGQALFSAKNATIAPDQRLIVSVDRGQLQFWGIRE